MSTADSSTTTEVVAWSPWQYWLNLVLVALTVLTVIANVIVSVGNAAFLGLTDIQWHWIVLLSAILTALNTAFNHTPPLQKPPTGANRALYT